MAEAIDNTFGGSTKLLLGSVSFLCLMFGGYSMKDAGGNITFTAVILFALGIVAAYAAVCWRFVREKLPPSIVREINRIATSPKWWLALILALCLSVPLSRSVSGNKQPQNSALSSISTPAPEQKSSLLSQTNSLPPLSYCDLVYGCTFGVAIAGAPPVPKSTLPYQYQPDSRCGITAHTITTDGGYYGVYNGSGSRLCADTINATGASGANIYNAPQPSK